MTAKTTSLYSRIINREISKSAAYCAIDIAFERGQITRECAEILESLANELDD